MAARAPSGHQFSVVESLCCAFSVRCGRLVRRDELLSEVGVKQAGGGLDAALPFQRARRYSVGRAESDPNMAGHLSRFRGWAKLWRSGVIADKRTVISVETERVLIIRRRRSIRAWCAECGCEVDLVDETEAGALTGTPGAALRDRAQARGWHVSEDEDGTGFVCLQSLLRSSAKANAKFRTNGMPFD